MKTPVSALAGIPTLEQHPLARELSPGGMSEEEHAALTEDITQRGLIYPIVLHEGMVLDGWHRYRACVESGTALKTMEYAGSDPAGFVAACTVLRRRLSSLQRALVGARMHLEHKVAQRDVCRKYGISNTVLALVLKALQTKNAPLISRIENDGDFTRGMLREELADAGVVHQNYGSAAPPPPTIATSVFDQARAAAAADDTDGIDEDEDLIGGPLPDTGKRRHKPERRAKDTPAQHAQDVFKDLWGDLDEEDQRTFLQMVWPLVRPLAEELKLPGLGGKGRAKLSKVA